MFLRRNDNGNFNGSSTVHDYYDINFELDILGRHKKVTNELGQETVFEHNLLPPDKQKTGTVYTDSPDNGWRLVLANVVKNPVRQWDERGNRFRNEYDIAQRPIKNWVDEGSGEKLAGFQVFEENINMPNPRSENLKGELIRGFDESGVMKSKDFDFKGNLLKGEKQLAVAYKGIVDWSFLTSETSLSALDNAAQAELQTEGFETQTEYDALDRPTLTTQPDGSQYRPTYNKAALPEKMATKLAHESTFSEIVTGIDYNSKKQRTAVYYGNGSKTKYTYDPATFRLKRLLTTRNTGQDIMQDLNYTFDGVGNITEMVDNAQQTEYFKNSVISPRNKYSYNSLYRLTKATGREKSNLPPPSSSGYAPEWIPTNGKSNESLSSYCRQYSYDPMGNILELIHRETCSGSENWKKTFAYTSGMGNNYLLSSYTGSTPPTSPQFSYDAHGNMLEMPHLQAMAWDYADQLQSTEKNGETTYYIYSGGERIRKVVVDTSGTNEKIKYERIYLGDYELYRKYDASGNLKNERKTHHIQGEGQATALLEVKTTDNGSPVANPMTIRRYQYGNHLGSACLELDKNAEVLSYQEYHPFGTTSFEMHTNDSEVSLKRYQYVFKERDTETGLYYYGARYYAPWLCRFVSVDPLKDDYPQLSPYNYASDNPVTHKDVDGMQNPAEEKLQQLREVKIDKTRVAKPRKIYDLPENSTISAKKPKEKEEEKGNIIIEGSNDKEITIPIGGDKNVYLPIPFDIPENRTLELGLSNIKPSNLAAGYSLEGYGESSFLAGGNVSGGVSVVNFYNQDYGNYNYVYAQTSTAASLGDQAGADAGIKANFFVMYNFNANTNSIPKPSSFQGSTTSYGISGDIEDVVGAGFEASVFKSRHWHGVSVGLSIGTGESFNIGNVFREGSTSILLNNEKKTKNRGFWDRFINQYSFKGMLIQAGIQYYEKKHKN